MMIRQFLSMNMGVKAGGSAPLVVAPSFMVQATDAFTRADSATVGGDATEGGAGTNAFAIISNAMGKATGSATGLVSFGGDHVGVGVTRFKHEAKGVDKSSWATSQAFYFGFFSESAPTLMEGATCNGYWMQNNSGSLNVWRSIGATQAVIITGATTMTAGVPADLALEFEQSGDSFLIRVYKNGVQVGSDFEDTGPATELLTTCRPHHRVSGFPSVTIASVETSY